MRVVKPGFFHVDASPLARLLFAGLWCVADKEGRLNDRPRRLRAEILPNDTDADAEALLTELERGDYIARYEVDGEHYIAVLKFREHQRPHPREAESTIPPRPNNTQVRRRHDLGVAEPGINRTEPEQNQKGTEGGHARGSLMDSPFVQAYLATARAAGRPDTVIYPSLGEIDAQSRHHRQGGVADDVLVMACAECGKNGGSPRMLHIEIEKALRQLQPTHRQPGAWRAHLASA